MNIVILIIINRQIIVSAFACYTAKGHVWSSVAPL